MCFLLHNKRLFIHSAAKSAIPFRMLKKLKLPCPDYGDFARIFVKSKRLVVRLHPLHPQLLHLCTYLSIPNALRLSILSSISDLPCFLELCKPNNDCFALLRNVLEKKVNFCKTTIIKKLSMSVCFILSAALFCLQYQKPAFAVICWNQVWFLQQKREFHDWSPSCHSRTPENGGMTDALSPVLSKVEERGRRCLFLNSTMVNLMVYQDGIEVDLLQLFVHSRNSECFFYNIC